MSVTKKAVQRSMPNPHRPRLSTETEQKFADVDHRSAVCYAESEELAEKFKQLAAQLSGDMPAQDAVPEAINLEDPSAVHHLEELRERVKSDEITPLKR